MFFFALETNTQTSKKILNKLKFIFTLNTKKKSHTKFMEQDDFQNDFQNEEKNPSSPSTPTVTICGQDVDAFKAVTEVAQRHNIPCIGIFGLVKDTNKVPVVSSLDILLQSAKDALTKQDYEKVIAHDTTCEYGKDDIPSLDFLDACRDKDEAKAKDLLEKGMVNPHILLPYSKDLGFFAIHIAARYRSVLVLKYLLEECKVEINQRTFSGKTALHYAIGNFHAKCVKLLLSHGSDTKWIDNNGKLPIQMFSPNEVMEQDMDFNLLDQEVVDSMVEIYSMLKPQAQQVLSQKMLNFLEENIKKGQKRKEVNHQEEESKEDNLCMVCMESEADTTVFPCQHRVACKSCSAKLTETPNASTCIKCRREIEYIK